MAIDMANDRFPGTILSDKSRRTPPRDLRRKTQQSIYRSVARRARGAVEVKVLLFFSEAAAPAVPARTASSALIALAC